MIIDATEAQKSCVERRFEIGSRAYERQDFELLFTWAPVRGIHGTHQENRPGIPRNSVLHIHPHISGWVRLVRALWRGPYRKPIGCNAKTLGPTSTLV